MLRFIIPYLLAFAVNICALIKYLGGLIISNPIGDADDTHSATETPLHDEGNILPQPSPQPDVVTHVDEITEIENPSPSPPPPPIVDIANGYDSVLMTKTLPKMPKFNALSICELIGSLGGLIIGYLLTVAGGVLGMDLFLLKLSPTIFVKKKKAKENNFCFYINQWILLFVSSLHLSIIVSLFLGLRLSNCWGRKPVLIIGSFLLLVGVGLTTWFPNILIETTGRIILGVGLGFIYQVIPMILSETASEETRGKVDKLFQLQSYAGALLALMVNYIASRFHVWGWRLSFGVVGIPVTLLFLASLAVSETPTYLIQHDQSTKAKETLMRIRGTEVEVEFEELSELIKRNQVNNPIKEILKPLSRPALVITTMSQVLQPLLGMNVFVNYGPLLFQSINYTSHVAFLTPMIINCFSMPLAFVSPFISNLIGRRMLNLVACAASFFSQIFTWAVLFLDLDPNHHLKRYEVYITMSMVVVSVAGNAILTGPDGWLSETFPGKTTVLGSAWVVGVSMFMNVLMAQVTLRLYCFLGVWIFIFFAACNLATAFFIFFLVPETTGIKKHALIRKVWSCHWFWKRYMLDGEDLYA